MKSLPIRTVFAVLLIGLLALVLWLGGWVQAIVLGLFSVSAVHEMTDIFRIKDIYPFSIPLLIMGGTEYIVLYKLGSSWLLLLAVLVFFALMIERILNPKRTTLDLVASLGIMIYPLSMLLCLGAVGFGRTDYSRMALFCCFAGPCMADNAAYMIGSVFGKHKLCPAVSPNKTIEGAVSGVIFGALGGVLAFYVQKLWGFDISIWFYIIVCFIGGIIGQFGDLLSSTFKRWAGVKDFGNLIPGHGGAMDRLDSAMIAAPMVLAAFTLFIR